MTEKKKHDNSKLSYDIEEAADFLKVDRSTVLELAGSGQLPGAKIGRAWVFLVADLVTYLNNEIHRQQRKRRGDDQPPKRTGGGRRQPLPQLPELPDQITTRPR